MNSNGLGGYAEWLSDGFSQSYGPAGQNGASAIYDTTTSLTASIPRFTNVSTAQEAYSIASCSAAVK